MDNQDEALRLQSRLAEIDSAGEKPEMGGAILVGHHICLSGFAAPTSTLTNQPIHKRREGLTPGLVTSGHVPL
jgi:hypothetical protein